MLIFLVIGTPRVNNLMSIWAFYRYHTYTRNRSFNVLHRGAALFQQYMVCFWLSIEMHRLESISGLTSRSCAPTCTIPPAVSCWATKMWQQPVDALCFPLRSPEACAICNAPIRTPWP